MKRYLLSRILQNIVTLFLFLTAVYLLLDLQPGDFGDLYLSDPRLTPAQRQVLRADLGLDKPVLARYGNWLSKVFQGDLGISFSNYPRPVLEVIAERAPRTVLLFVSIIVFSYYLGFLSGKILAWKRGEKFEAFTTVVGVSLYTVFLPWFALMMIWFFAYTLGLFPIGRFADPVVWRSSPVDANFVFNRMLLTALIASLTLVIWAVFTRRLYLAQRSPLFWAGAIVVLIGVLAYWWSTGVGRFALDILHHMILPVLTLTLVNFAGVMLLTRTSMLETLREDYIMVARAKGLPERVVRDQHAARNAMLPVVTSFALAMSFVLDGGVITETIFSWPGMGRTLLIAAQTQDIPMVIGALLFTGILALTGHLLADILYAYLDPRIRYS